MRECFLGIDMGTTGIRSILADRRGEVLLSANADIKESIKQSADGVMSEEIPSVWEKALGNVLDSVFSRFEKKKWALLAITVDSTSGTILPIGRDHKPIGNAMMHNDMRATKESEFINRHTGINVKPSFALSKILWIKNNLPDIFDKTHKFLHAADYLVGLISGEYEKSDFSNAVKTGYDLDRMKWPDEIEEKLGIPIQKLPGVVKTGEVIGELKNDIKNRYGLSGSIKIVAGATDSTTGFYSSGAKVAGDWNTTLGTVLGIRGISKNFIPDPAGVLYTHRHPEGFWLPGGASNSGGEVLRVFFGNSVKDYDRLIKDLPPTGGIVYPLSRKGEKFPFFNLSARGFIKLDFCEPPYLFKAMLEGLSFLERMIYSRIEEIGYRVNSTLFSMGGGAYSEPWLKIRSTVMNRIVARAKIVETAFGACVIAASGSFYSGITESIENMVSIEKYFEPDESEKSIYEEKYNEFVEELNKRGYLKS